MFIQHLFSNPVEAILFIIAIVFAVSIHEFAHAKTADHLGDPTAELEGRVTLNPKAHLDLFGSLMFLFIGFGWGKPVPFDPFNLKNPRRDSALISLAGPLSNMISALICSVLLKSLTFLEPSFLTIIGQLFLAISIRIHISLGIFNLLPFAPLDGFKIVGGFLSEKQAKEWYSLERYGILFLLFFLFPFSGGKSMLEIFILPVINFLYGVLI